MHTAYNPAPRSPLYELLGIKVATPQDCEKLGIPVEASLLGPDGEPFRPVPFRQPNGENPIRRIGMTLDELLRRDLAIYMEERLVDSVLYGKFQHL